MATCCNIVTTNDQQWQQVVKAFTPQTSRYWRLSVSQLWPHSESVEICELNFFGYMLPTPKYMHSASHKSAQAASATTSNGLLGTMESAWGGGPEAHNVAVYGFSLCVVGIVLRYTVFASPRIIRSTHKWWRWKTAAAVPAVVGYAVGRAR